MIEFLDSVPGDLLIVIGFVGVIALTVLHVKWLAFDEERRRMKR